MALAARPQPLRCPSCFARLCADETDLTHRYNGRCRANAPAPVKTVRRAKRKRSSTSWYGLEFD